MSRYLQLALTLWLLPLPASFAADHSVEAGQTLTLTQDLVLGGNDVLEVKGTPDKRCTRAPAHEAHEVGITRRLYREPLLQSAPR